MKNWKKLLSLILAVFMVASLAACGGEETPETPSDDAVEGGNVTYTVLVQTAGGMVMEGLDIYVYADDTLSDLKGYGKTNAEGKVTFDLPQAEGYAMTVSGAPKGYQIKDSYPLSGTATKITLSSQLITDGSLSEVSLGLGDVMYDFTVTTAAGEEFTLSKALEGKKMALLNFFFTTCGPCANEFPYMNEAYDLYSDDVVVVALDPLEQNDAVKSYQESMGLTFPMAACPAAWSATFGITGYPTSVVVDQYGVICLIEVGGLTSLRPFASMFEHFTADDYTQKLCVNGVADVITVMKPTAEMPAAEEIAAAVQNGAELPIVYRPEEGEDAEYSWPFVISEKNGETCLKTSNTGIEGSYAILYMDVELKAGQAIGFDYLRSTETNADYLHVIVDDEAIYSISGYFEEERWETCYPWVAIEDGTYEVALCYIKDDSDNVGDDAIYVKNVRIVDQANIDAITQLPREVATSTDGFTYTYADIVLNEQDGYYHVGTANGPLLLANLMGYTQFSEEETVWDMAYNGAVSANGEDYYEKMVQYFNYASNSNLNGFCTVNQELAEMLKVVDETCGFDDADDQEWLRFCKYYEVYGGTEQLEDPIKGLATFSAFEAKLGVGVASNKFEYNGRPIMPRGLLAKFVPTTSGVYRITSHNDSTDGVDGWIFDEDRNLLLTYESDERMFNEAGEVSMVLYMEAGKPYFIDIAYWDVYEVGTITYDITYLGATVDLFRLASPGYFTYDTDATGEAMYHLIAGGIDVVLGEDGIYYHDLGNGQKGSKIYCDFTGMTPIFNGTLADVPAYNSDGTLKKDENGNTVMIQGMITKGQFDFSRSEGDEEVLQALLASGGDREKAIEYLKATWGEDFEHNAEFFEMEAVLDGKRHGTGEDLTAQISAYLDDIITSGPQERIGCVVVTEELAEILTKLMEKYTFQNVDHPWTKLCYYYDHLGPQ